MLRVKTSLTRNRFGATQFASSRSLMDYLRRNSIRYMFLAAIAVSAVPFVLYFYRFHGKLSHDNEIWAHFGDFIGGVLGPALALIGLIGLLSNLRAQQAESSKTDNSRRVSDLKSALDLLDKNMDKHLDHVLSRRFNLPPKNRFPYLIATKLASDLEMCRSLLLDLAQLEPDSSIIRYFKHKYAEVGKILFKKKYSEETVHHYFGPA